MGKITNIIFIACLTLLLFFSGYCGYKVHFLSNQQERIKQDYSITNNISFGLLSVSEWRDQLVEAVNHQLHNFRFTKSQEGNLKKEVEQILHSLIDEAFSLINKPQKSLGGKLKKLAFKTFVDEDKLHEQVPVFSEQILKQIEKPSSKHRLENVAETELKQLEKQTFDSAEHERAVVLDSIFHKYRVADKEGFEKKSSNALTDIKHQTYLYTFCLLGCIVVVLILWIIFRNKPAYYKMLFIMSVLFALVVLLTGLTTTMIELDARIASLDFKVIGTTISFRNQVLFFQSKSIIDVVTILLKTGKFDSIIVGFLILCFSVLFPFTKLISTGIYLLSEKKWARGKFIQFFAFKSGKWSMADVMVVAIMMTYIGFNGVLESQLAGLNIRTESLTSITTNNTALQPGYIVFVTFVVFGLILAQILKKITQHKEV